jgi:hypothetical protein
MEELLLNPPSLKSPALPNLPDCLRLALETAPLNGDLASTLPPAPSVGLSASALLISSSMALCSSRV